MSWVITLGISLLCHSVFVFFLSLNLWPHPIQARPSPYTVMLMPVAIPEPPTPPSASPSLKEPEIKPAEKTGAVEKPREKPKKDDIVEKVKKREEDRETLERLEKAIEEIRRQTALDAIQKRVERREVSPPSSQPSPIPSPPVFPESTHPSTATPAPSLSPALRQSKLNEYYGWLWAKIKSSWTIPELLLREGIDLETIIVIIIDKEGRVKKSWFEKRSGNALYDQMAMRAIIKADPLPPIPKELNLESLEVGVRFIPD